MILEPNTRFVRAMLLAALLMLTACASQGPQRGTATPTASTQTPSGNPDQLAGDALQALAAGNGQQALAAIARANVLAPKRPDLAWLHARTCMLSPGCEPELTTTSKSLLTPHVWSRKSRDCSRSAFPRRSNSPWLPPGWPC